MSEATTGLFNNAPVFPRLVLDETLKRARVETSEGTAVRVTSAAADLTPITDALGTQQDPATTPTVIGLLKNLIASGGGSGGGGAGSTYPVFKSFLCVLQYSAEEEITSFPFDITLEDNLYTIFNDPETHYPVPTTAPDWATTILLFDHHLAGMCLINNTDKVGYQTVFSRVGRVGDDYDSLDNNIALGVASYTLMPTWQDGKWHLSFSRGNNDFISFNTTDPATTLEGVKNGYYNDWGGVDMYALFLDTNPLAISGGGGSGESISTYSLTLNNVTVTDITAPTEDPPSSDDQTLSTVSYVDGALTAYTKSTPMISSHVRMTPQSPTLTLDTPPTWCRYLQITVRLAGAHQTTNVSYNPAPAVPHTNFGITRQYWLSSDNKLRTVWCEFDYENATNTITWTNYVVWDINFTTGTASKLYAGLDQYEDDYPLNIVSVVALA